MKFLRLANAHRLRTTDACGAALSNNVGTHTTTGSPLVYYTGYSTTNQMLAL